MFYVKLIANTKLFTLFIILSLKLCIHVAMFFVVLTLICFYHFFVY